MVAKMKILEKPDGGALADAINAHLEDGWKIAGNSYNAFSPSPGKRLYSILLMKIPEEEPVLTDEELEETNE